MKPRHVVIPIFIPHKGCPFDCIYCNQKLISGQLEEMTASKIKEIVETHLSTLKGDENVEIGFYGGSFTGIEREKQLEFLETANQYTAGGSISGIRLSTRPDYITAEILGYLKRNNVKTVELGVQSMDEDVLRRSCRGHDAKAVVEAALLVKQWGIELGIQTMLGLPGSSADKELYTAGQVIALAPSFVRIYPTLVIKDTYLEKMFREGSYTPVPLDSAVEICSTLLDMYESAGIDVIRVGLQPTENITKGSDVVAGPFHPAFRQLVESRRMRQRLEKQMEAGGFKGRKESAIYAFKGDISYVIGQKKENIKYLKNKFGLKNLKVYPVDDEAFEPRVSDRQLPSIAKNS